MCTLGSTLFSTCLRCEGKTNGQRRMLTMDVAGAGLDIVRNLFGVRNSLAVSSVVSRFGLFVGIHCCSNMTVYIYRI